MSICLDVEEGKELTECEIHLFKLCFKKDKESVGLLVFGMSQANTRATGKALQWTVRCVYQALKYN